MGAAGWYRKFIPDYATIAAPIFDAEKGKQFKFSDEAKAAFDHLKRALISSPLLGLLRHFYRHWAQRNYFVTERECLVVVLAIKKFRPYVELMPFSVITDHSSLKWLMSHKDLSESMERISADVGGLIGLGSAAFGSSDYSELVTTIEANSELLLDLKVVECFVYKGSTL
ncbi:hypothetical protein EVAR_71729_1 [Eumeta japonica]|uniref:Reverse transcriptase RNase H-like domain-containing protein n=1 Tax=Eumeta variegata TaxID=151549 RepID=A0A4C1SV92_EUMVA|nr:hypothetical protein EVAR_71729_1 [Eumeta japonica]